MTTTNDSLTKSPRQEPKLMSLSNIRNIVGPHIEQLSDGFFIDGELAILHGRSDLLSLVIQQEPPFSINDHRLGIVAKGSVDANINLQEKHIAEGCLVYLGPGTVISPLRLDPDLEIYGFALSPAFTMPFAPGALPAAFNGQVRDFQLPASEADLLTARQIVETMWQVTRQKDYNRAVVGSLVAAQMNHYAALFDAYSDHLQQRQSREQTIFDRFIYLVNTHAAREHHIAFYAGKMCLTERYLGTVIRQASGITAKEWIDRALITRIQVELRHTSKSIAQIAEETCFPSASFFSKYFKRITQMTPAAYRHGPATSTAPQ